MTPSRKESERNLALLAGKGDERAFGKLYETYFDGIYRYFFFRTNNETEAEDLSGQCFLQAWEYLTRKPSRIKDFRAWLYRIAHNLLVDHYLKKTPNYLGEEPDLYAENQLEPEDRVLLEEEQQLLTRGLSQLDEMYREVLICRMISGLSHAETAIVLGVKEGHVRVLQHRAIKKMRAFLVEETGK